MQTQGPVPDNMSRIFPVSGRVAVRAITIRCAAILGVLWLPLQGCGSRSAAAVAHSPLPAPPGVSAAIPFDAHLLVDQFGYRPGDPKVAVIRDPRVGYDAASRFSPGSAYQVRRTADGSVVFSARLTPWNHGAVEASSGDRGWWFDFSALDTPGSYFIYDPQTRVRSATFLIAPDVYRKVLRAAMRMFYYQRSGLAKQAPYAEACWVDGPSYIGPHQDLDARDITDPDNPAKVRNVSGGWFDAGDTNKYVTFAVQPVHQLLTAYQENPKAFGDDFGIPESGNGIPDVLDEVKWETDWLKRMQYPDGSAALKVGETVYASAAPPSSDHSPRFYIPSCSSATIAVAGMFAHAAYVYAAVPGLRSEAFDLKRRAISAWNSYQRLPAKQTHCDTGVVHAGNADWSVEQQNAEAVVAAIYLFATTDDPAYGAYIRAHFHELRPYRDVGWSRYEPEQGEALLFYTSLPHADPRLRRIVLADKMQDVMKAPEVYGFRGQDLYRSFMPDAQYHWGSNNPRAQYGNTNMDVITYHLDDAHAHSYRDRALSVLHYFHGVNPFGMVYLSNMYSLGATRSVNEIYDTWFAHGTLWSDALASRCGPPPGYVPGGPNAQAVQNGVPATLRPPAGQPPQKAYRDWNVGYPENSWAVTEPGIYYQSAYVKLLSKFVP
jgi:endoglucanase